MQEGEFPTRQRTGSNHNDESLVVFQIAVLLLLYFLAA